MNTNTIPYGEWPAFLSELGQRFSGSPTTIRVRDNLPKRHGLELTGDLPLVAIEHDLRPKETVRLRVRQASGASTTVEIEHPRFITIMEGAGAPVAAGKMMVFEIETASQTYFLQIGPAPCLGCR